MQKYLVLLFVLAACSPRGLGAPADVLAEAADAEVPADAPANDGDAPGLDAPDSGDLGAPEATVDAPNGEDTPAVTDASDAAVACRTTRDCAARSVCDRSAGRCVECVTGADCSGATPVCMSNRCVAGVACTSSRMCPGQVCDMTSSRCVDCVADADCTGASLCQRNNCVPPPTPCRSSRECSASDQVCDTARGVCADCAADADCTAADYCAPDHTCARRVCAPGAQECVDPRRSRTCTANGGAWTEAACASGMTCTAGRCQAQLCAPGAVDCGSGTERRTCNPDGLGYTMAPCAAMESCSAGVCRPWTCTPSSASCVSSTSVSVCNADGLGARTMTCSAGASCTGGRCNSWLCTPGEASCASLTERRVCNADGLGYSPSACPLPARALSTTCASGRCGFTCASGFGDCNGSASDGCETDLSSNVASCGACGSACSARLNASGVCAGGACGVMCFPGYADCNGLASDGCEVNVQTSVTSCGACGNACPARPNASPMCAVSRCGIVCASGYGDCDGGASNGCEADLRSDALHCGACGRACATGQACQGGACRSTCIAGQIDCTPTSSTPTCVNPLTDDRNCGACGNACPTGTTCASGVCACSPGTTRCGSQCVNTFIDSANCGACGRACTTAQICDGGACVPGCVAPLALCGGACTNLASDRFNCGRCANACPSGTACFGGACGGTPPVNDTRAGATTISLTATAQTLSADTSTARNDTAGACLCTTGQDVFFRFVLTAPEIIYADTFGTTWNTSLFLQNSAGMNVANTPPFAACSDDPSFCTGFGAQSQIVTRLTAGTWYLVLSGCGSGAAQIHFQHLPGGNGTAAARIAPNTSTQTVAGSVAGTGTVTSSCCSGGPDLALWWITCPNADASGFYASTCSASTGTNLASYDVEIAQYSALRSPGVAVCNDDTGTTCGTGSTLTSTIPATTANQAGLNTLIVDACSGSGTFVVNHILATCPSGTRCATCADTNSDRNNCGACNRRCTTTQVCTAGVCR